VCFKNPFFFFWFAMLSFGLFAECAAARSADAVGGVCPSWLLLRGFVSV
jgi:hypothetical protein